MSSIQTATTANSNTNVIKNLIKDISENLNVNGDEFTKENFDLKSFSTAIIKTNQLNEHLTKLAQNINFLDKEIRDQVSQHHEDLLSQAVNIETLEEMLDMVQTRISSLKSTSERLRIKISQPFNELNLRILQLSRLQSACDTLRLIKGILHHSARLRIHMKTGEGDLVKSAQCLNELEFLMRDFDSSGIEIIEQDVMFAHKSRHEVEEQAQIMLNKGLQHENQTQIGTALQVFYSLGILTSKLSNCLKSNEKHFHKLANDLLDTTNLTLLSTSSGLTTTQSSVALSSLGASNQFPGRVNMPNVGSMSQFRAQLWSNVEKLMDTMRDCCFQVVQLQQILEKKKDSLSNVFYVDEIDFTVIYKGKMYLNDQNEPDDITKLAVYDSICVCIDVNDVNGKKSVEFLYEHWRLLTSVLNSSLLSACAQSNYIKQTFQTEYPRLLRLQNELWSRIVKLNPLIERYRYMIATTDKTKRQFSSSYELLRKCFIDLENAYLNRSLSQLFDPINLIFSQTTSLSDRQINRADIETFIKGIQAQLQTLQYDLFNLEQNQSNTSVFSDKVVSNICKSIQMYANKSEQVLNSLNLEMQQMTASSNSKTTDTIFSLVPNQIQMKNLDYVNVTHDLYEQLTRMFENEKLNKRLNEKLLNALKTLIVFEENALAPFIKSASDCIQAIILTIHQEDFNQQTNSCSLYVKELQQVLQRICRDYLQLYQCKQILNPYLNQLAVRCIDFFIRHASILRPMSESTRQRLVIDSQQIETIIQVILCPKLTDLGVSYKQLKAFRHLLTLKSPLDVDSASSLGDNVVDESHYSVIISESLPYSVLLHYLFSFAPTDFKSPHQSLDWPLVRYSDWLDKHTNEKDRLIVIKTCLEAYVNSVREKNATKFATIYPLMVRLLGKSLSN